MTAPLLIAGGLLAAQLVWLILRVARPCNHQSLTGVANYYDSDLGCFVHLRVCDDCGEYIITGG